MEPSVPSVRALDPAEVEATAATLADAFDVDAAYRYLFPGPERAAGLRDLFARNLRLHLPHGCTWVARDERGVTASLTVRPPGGLDIGLMAMVRSGLVPFALVRGPRVVRRLLWLKSTYDALEHAAAGGAPHWYLHMMAVRPDVQGTGVGSRVLDEVLARTVATRPDVPIALTTHIERNLPFYGRIGLAVCSEQVLRPPDGAPYTVWSMNGRMNPL